MHLILLGGLLGSWLASEAGAHPLNRWQPALKAKGSGEVREAVGEVHIDAGSLRVDEEVSAEPGQAGTRVVLNFAINYPKQWTLAQPTPQGGRVKVSWSGKPLPVLKFVPAHGIVYELELDPGFAPAGPVAITGRSCEASGLSLEGRSGSEPAIASLECAAGDVLLKSFTDTKLEARPRLAEEALGEAAPRAVVGPFEIWDREGRRMRRWYSRVEAGFRVLLQAEDTGNIFTGGANWNPQLRLSERFWVGGNLGLALLASRFNTTGAELDRFLALQYLVEGGVRLPFTGFIRSLEASLRGGLRTWIGSRGGTFPSVGAKLERRVHWTAFKWWDGVHLSYDALFTSRFGYMHELQLGVAFKF